MGPLRTNWTGRRIVTGRGYAAAQSVERVKEVVNEAIARRAKICAVAGRFSDTGVLGTTGLQVNVVGLRVGGVWARPYDATVLRSQHAARARYFVEVGAGATVQKVNEILSQHGLALPMIGAFSGQTLIGAIQTSTHGTGCSHGPLANRVRSIEIVVARPGGAEVWRVEPPGPRALSDRTILASRGVLLRGDRAGEEDYFDALCVSVGAIGIITSVVVDAVDAFRLRSKNRGMRWREVRNELSANPSPIHDAALHGYAVLVNPYSGMVHGDQECVVSELSVIHGADPNLPRSEGGAPACTDDIGQATEIAIPTKHHIAPNLSQFVVKPGPGGAYENWNDSFRMLAGDNRYPPGISFEYAFPLDTYLDAMDALLDKLRALHARDMSVVGPVSLRFVGQSDAFLALSEGGPRATVEVLAALGSSTIAMHHGDQALAGAASVAFSNAWRGRPHWGQLLLGKMSTIAARYPKYRRWKAARDAMDPMGLFLNLPWP